MPLANSWGEMDETWHCKSLKKPGPGQARNILVVDDEPAQLETIRRGLFLYGYRTLCASSADEACQLLLGADSDVDLLVTDLTMPGSSGFDLIQRIRGTRPQFPIVVITGLAVTREVEDLRRQGILVVRKPFSPDQLDRAIRGLGV